MRPDRKFGERLRRFFTPTKLQAISDGDTPPGFTVLSGNYFKVANKLRVVAEGDTAPVATAGFVFAAVIMYMAAFEAFLQEHLTLSLYSLEVEKEANDTIRLLEQLKVQSKPYNDFRVFVKSCGSKLLIF